MLFINKKTFEVFLVIVFTFFIISIGVFMMKKRLFNEDMLNKESAKVSAYVENKIENILSKKFEECSLIEIELVYGKYGSDEELNTFLKENPTSDHRSLYFNQNDHYKLIEFYENKIGNYFSNLMIGL